MKSLKQRIQRRLAPLHPALRWWRERYVYRVFWACAMKRMSTKMMLGCLFGGVLLYSDKLLWAPVLELDQMPVISGVMEEVASSGGRHKRWRIQLRLDDGEILWFDRTHTKKGETERLQNSEGKRVKVWYQKEYSLFPPFFYRHANLIRAEDEEILAYRWLLKNMRRYEAQGTGDSFRHFYAGAALFGLIGIWIMCCCGPYTPERTTKPKDD